MTTQTEPIPAPRGDPAASGQAAQSLGRIEAVPRLAQRIRARQLVLGVVVKMPCQALIETLGHLDYDAAIIDTEHGIADNAELEHHLRAADSADIAVIVRVGSNDPAEINRVLDAGAAGVIVPHVNTAADADRAVRAAHYPPRGERGLALSTRGGRHGTADLAAHLDSARVDTVVIAQIEHRDAVGNAAAIAATDGVDAVWIGPSDLSMSLGHPGQLDHPVVATAIDSIVEATASSDAALCVIPGNDTDVHAWARRGATVMFVVSTNLIVERFRRLAATARTTPHPEPAPPAHLSTPTPDHTTDRPLDRRS